MNAYIQEILELLRLCFLNGAALHVFNYMTVLNCLHLEKIPGTKKFFSLLEKGIKEWMA